MHAEGEASRWHVDHWPPLSKLEALIKLVAFGLAYAAFAIRIGRAPVPIGDQPITLARLGIFALLALGSVAAIWHPWRRRESVSLVFAVLNATAHWLLFVSLLRGAEADFWLTLFASLMLLSELVTASRFLPIGSAPTRSLTPTVGTVWSGIHAVGYLVVISLPQMIASIRG